MLLEGGRRDSLAWPCPLRSFPVPQQVQPWNLNPMEWRSAKRSDLGSKLGEPVRSRGLLLPFFPSAKLKTAARERCTQENMFPGCITGESRSLMVHWVFHSTEQLCSARMRACLFWNSCWVTVFISVCAWPVRLHTRSPLKLPQGVLGESLLAWVTPGLKGQMEHWHEFLLGSWRPEVRCQKCVTEALQCVE